MASSFSTLRMGMNSQTPTNDIDMLETQLGNALDQLPNCQSRKQVDGIYRLFSVLLEHYQDAHRLLRVKLSQWGRLGGQDRTWIVTRLQNSLNQPTPTKLLVQRPLFETSNNTFRRTRSAANPIPTETDLMTPGLSSLPASHSQFPGLPLPRESRRSTRSIVNGRLQRGFSSRGGTRAEEEGGEGGVEEEEEVGEWERESEEEWKEQEKEKRKRKEKKSKRGQTSEPRETRETRGEGESRRGGSSSSHRRLSLPGSRNRIHKLVWGRSSR